MEILWHKLTYNKALEQLKTSEKGLSDKESQKRIDKYGYNELIQEDKWRTLKLFLRQFKGFFIVFLLIATAISFFIGEHIDAYIILGAVLLNIVFGFFQEYKAAKILRSLKKHIINKAHVLRNGQEKLLKTKFLVPGDIVFLEQGDRVPADIRLGQAQNLSTDEAFLTGEAMPVNKDTEKRKGNAILAERHNMAYQGTLVVRGEGRGIVVATGKETELGKISQKLSEEKEDATPLQKKINQLSKFIGYLVLISFILILIDGLWFDAANIKEIFVTAVAVAVSAIPEGLIVSVTVILAIGMRELSKRKAYVKKLAAAETLGGVTVILTDKTGTLTEARMVVDSIQTADKKNQEIIYRALLFANSARVENPDANFADWRYTGSPTEVAMLKEALAKGNKEQYFQKDKFIKDALLFDSERKFQARLVKMKYKKFICLVGAPEKILERVSYRREEKNIKLNKKTTDKIYQEAKDFATQGLRVLGVAYKEVDDTVEKLQDEIMQDLIFLGFVNLKDPLRRDVKEVFQSTKKAGIKTVIVTGDHALTAKAIAKDLGFQVLQDQIISGDDISKLSEADLESKLKKIIIFARVSPHDKVRILKAYQEQGEVVAMTGDGINDALALKDADIGVALGSGQEVAREAADLVLLDNNFKSIVSAIKYGRVVFSNIRKVIVYLLTDSFAEILLVGGAIMFGMPLPIIPAQILWINLIEDTLPNFALALEKGEKGAMQRKPRSPKSPLLDKEMKFIIFAIGFLTDLLLFGLFWYLYKQGSPLEYIRTMIFASLTIDTFFIIFAIKSLRQPIFKIHTFDNPYLLIAALIGIIMLVGAIYLPFLQNILELVPLNLRDWIVVGSLGIVQLLGVEFSKWLFHRKEWSY
jgi:calcium-translocating P-type ATPase